MDSLIKTIESFEYSWSADVIMQNGFVRSIWCTAFPMMKNTIKEVIWIASDYPKFKIERDGTVKN